MLKTIANELNNYFCNIGHELFTNIPHADPSYDALIAFNSHSMALFPATNDEVTTIIHHTKNNSNLGDILPSFYIKKCHDILIDQWSHYTVHQQLLEQWNFSSRIKNGQNCTNI